MAVEIYGLYAPRVGHIQTIGTLYNDETEAASASGVLIGDRLIITNNHAIPRETDYRSLQIFVRLGSRETEAVKARLAARDEAADLAILELETAATPTPFCPVTALVGSAQVPIGSKVFVLGFPLDQDLSITDGLLSNRSAALKWQTSTLLNKGNSGGPVFSAKGHLLGIAVGGITSWRIGDRTYDVDGVNFFIPADRLAHSPIADTIAQHTPANCWQTRTTLPGPAEFAWNVPRAQTWIEGPGAGQSHALAALDSVALATESVSNARRVVAAASTNSAPAMPRRRLPAEFSRSYTVSAMKDDHPGLSPHSQAYQDIFQAAPGYQIDSCKLALESANNASETSCQIASDKRSVRLRYRLQSGPLFDRWRGWLFGSVTLAQSKAE